MGKNTVFFATEMAESSLTQGVLVDMNKVWDEVLASIRQRTNEYNFNIWFRPIRCTGTDLETKTVSLELPNKFTKDWVQQHYVDIIEDEVNKSLGETMKIELSVSEQPVVSAPAAAKPSAAAPRKRPSRPTLATVKPQPVIGCELNPAFTFDSFVSGPNSDFAYAACLAVANDPGKNYNPLFLYGGTGVGKTHLLQAIAHRVNKTHPHLRVMFTTSERFTNEMITAISQNSPEQFRSKYRNQCDLLLVDDIEFIAGKTRTMEEFFHTFNELYEGRKHIVITSDQYPQDIKALDERLRSRLTSGLVCDIKMPDLETRMAILRKKAEMDRVEVSDKVIEFLARNFRHNVREMEGSLIRLEAYSSLTHTPISLDMAKDLLKEALQNREPDLNGQKIQKEVCRTFNIRLSDLKSKRRTQNLVYPRQIAMFLIKRHLSLPLSEIGHLFGGKDHTTVISSVNKIERLIGEDKTTRDTIENLEKQLEVWDGN